MMLKRLNKLLYECYMFLCRAIYIFVDFEDDMSDDDDDDDDDIDDIDDIHDVIRALAMLIIP